MPASSAGGKKTTACSCAGAAGWMMACYFERGRREVVFPSPFFPRVLDAGTNYSFASFMHVSVVPDPATKSQQGYKRKARSEIDAPWSSTNIENGS